MDKMNACEASSSKEGEKIAEAEVAGRDEGSSTNDNSPAHYIPITDDFLSFLPRLDDPCCGSALLSMWIGSRSREFADQKW